MELEPVTIETTFTHGADRLVGDLVAPSAAASGILVVFVEGSGPGGRDQGRWPDGLATHGIASLAYDKPGSGMSTGSWTTQSIGDRADETVAAVRHGVELGFDHVALIGFSQGGWVARAAATRSDQVDAVVTISGPAVDATTQERFRLRTQLPADGVAAHEVRVAIELFERRRAQMAAGDTGQAIWSSETEQRTHGWYRHSAGVTPDQIEFIARLLRHDPIPAIRQLRQPLLSVFGGRDLLVDVEESVAVLRSERPVVEGDRIVVVPDVDHSLRAFTGAGGPATRDGHFDPVCTRTRRRRDGRKLDQRTARRHRGRLSQDPGLTTARATRPPIDHTPAHRLR